MAERQRTFEMVPFKLLLLQLDTEPRAQMGWGSGSGRAYFWIRSDDQARGVFDRVVGFIQDS